MLRRIYVVFFLLFAFVGTLRANTSAQSWCEEGNRTVSISGLVSTTKVQQSFPVCTITVFLHNVTPPTLAILYSDNAVTPTPLANPFTASSTGFWQFYAADGNYDVVMSGAGFPAPFTLFNVQLLSGNTLPNFGAKCDGVTNDAAAVTAASTILNAAGGGNLIIPNGVTCLLGANVTTAASVVLVFQGGGKFSISSGFTLTINGSIDAPLQTVFIGLGSVVQGQQMKWPQVYPQWFGAAMDGVTDDTTALQAAVNFMGTAGSNFRNGKLMLTGPVAISNTISFVNRSLEVAGCGWGDQNATPKGCYVKWIRGSSSTTLDMFTFSGCTGMWVHDLRFIGSTTEPPQSAIGLKSINTGGAQSFNHFENIAIGPYPIFSDGVGQFTYGIYDYGINGNGDSMQWDNVTVEGATIGIYIAQSQNELHTFTTLGVSNNSVAGMKLASSVNINNASFGANPTDILFSKDLSNTSVDARVTISGFVSEGSNRFVDFNSAGTISLNLINTRFGFGNGNSPPDDGSCGPGTGSYVHCTKIIKAAGQSVALRAINFCIDENAYIGSQFPILDFSNPAGGGYQVDFDMQAEIQCGQVISPNILLGSASTGTNYDQHFRLRSFPDNSDGEVWEYWGGTQIGNVVYFIPTSGVIMHRDMFGVFNTCTGTCTLDLSKGMVQTFKITGNVTSWTVPNPNLVAGGLDRFSVWICAVGGNFTASTPTIYFNPVKQWGFTAAINDGTCANQMFEFIGMTNSPFTASVYAVTAFRNGITP